MSKRIVGEDTWVSKPNSDVMFRLATGEYAIQHIPFEWINWAILYTNNPHQLVKAGDPMKIDLIACLYEASKAYVRSTTSEL